MVIARVANQPGGEAGSRAVPLWDQTCSSTPVRISRRQTDRWSLGPVSLCLECIPGGVPGDAEGGRERGVDPRQDVGIPGQRQGGVFRPELASADVLGERGPRTVLSGHHQMRFAHNIRAGWPTRDAVEAELAASRPTSTIQQSGIREFFHWPVTMPLEHEVLASDPSCSGRSGRRHRRGRVDKAGEALRDHPGMRRYKVVVLLEVDHSLVCPLDSERV